MKPNNTLIITHDNCLDGIASEAILRAQYGDAADYLPLDHHDYSPKNPEGVSTLLAKLNAYSGAKVYLADICLPISWLETLLSNGNSVVVIDHHISAASTVAHFQERLAKGEKLAIAFLFDKKNTQSGALLTWRYIHGDTPAPRIIEYISDGDIWSFKFKETKWFYAGILNDKKPNDVRALLTRLIIEEDVELIQSIVSEGKALHSQFMAEVMEQVSAAIPIELLGIKGHLIKAERKYHSELGAAIAIKHGGFVLLIKEQENENDLISCSLRSHGDIDVSQIAAHFGGGGHKNAAGFVCSNLEALNRMLEDSAKKL